MDRLEPQLIRGLNVFHEKTIIEPRFKSIFYEGKLFEPRFECLFYERKPFEPLFEPRTVRLDLLSSFFSLGEGLLTPPCS